MTDDDVLVAVLGALNALAIPYMVTGSLATNFYGVPRSTKDGDLVLETGAKLPELAARLSPPLKLDPQMSFETITGTSRHVVQWAKGQFTVELFMLSDDSHDRERFRRRQRGVMLGVPVWLPTPEDVIITKLRWSQLGKRTKDVDDVRNVIAVQGGRIEWEYVHRWCDAHGTRELLGQVRSSIPRLDR
jgi:hypothetical protein